MNGKRNGSGSEILSTISVIFSTASFPLYTAPHTTNPPTKFQSHRLSFSFIHPHLAVRGLSRIIKPWISAWIHLTHSRRLSRQHITPPKLTRKLLQLTRFLTIFTRNSGHNCSFVLSCIHFLLRYFASLLWCSVRCGALESAR